MANTPLLVTIDGPAGVGKSTLAKHVAEALSIGYLDTGAMFRCIALLLSNTEEKKFLQMQKNYNEVTPYIYSDKNTHRQEEQTLHAKSIKVSDTSFAIKASILENIHFSLSGSGRETTLYCNGRKVGDEIRTEQTGLLAATFAAMPEVRDILKHAQQSIGNVTSLVAEGRDMGSVVFPHATCKIFLDATPEVRAERRFLQLQTMGKSANLAEIIIQIKERDDKDRNRAIAPLQPAHDAIIIDTSNKSLNTVFAEIMDIVHSVRP